MAKKKESTKTPQTEFIVGRIIEQANYRVKQDIDGWRNALTNAEAIHYPTLVPLYTLFREIELDAHIHGLVQQRMNRLLGLKFAMVKADGKEDKEAMKIFERAWFYKFLEKAIESKWWHHSLIQLWDKYDLGYKVVTIVRRDNVVPRKAVVTINQGDTTNAIAYREPPYSDWLVEVGDPEDLGLFCKAAPWYIIKKTALMEWAKYTQIFGMPIRVGKTASKQQADMIRMGTNLKNMESAAYGVFQEGETIEFIESTKGDAFNVYNQLIERANSELSKLFVGQTMTTDNGSSKSQGEVHERVADSITSADKRMIEFVVNDDLLPKMISHGFKLEGLRFTWSASKNLTAEMALLTQLLPYKNVPNDYITETFGIPVEDKLSDGNASSTEEPPVPKKKKKEELNLALLTEQLDIVKLHHQLKNIYSHTH